MAAALGDSVNRRAPIEQMRFVSAPEIMEAEAGKPEL